MNAVQKIGLLKMDFLGLRNLSIIEDCLKNLRETRKLDLVLADIPWDDPATFRLLQAGDTNGVFQLESAGLRRLLAHQLCDAQRRRGLAREVVEQPPVVGRVLLLGKPRSQVERSRSARPG